ncbi:uncharacterized protein CTHT_0031600 [Thermochaetoides thermophila DSM 1495]|uniref:Uncharacterized protein n=1 Tax=Chaetomium thermophilum (strain DSM 1495 / CBS 144.50 / IMI 039719) TaxID=759272 RepID=G0S4N1_CHATD|nr:hypothetical protein CTHT_0031600 [Thermochaetoides thermophila DSM 1495]EGS21306.1 hypothetical protein CTHT_0031600 [Thermochaetoides thermophila DSM 1495]
MLQAGANILAALGSARDAQLREMNATISVIEKLINAVSAVENQLECPLEKQASKTIIGKLHSFLIREATQRTHALPPSPTTTPPTPSEASLPEASAPAIDPASPEPRSPRV